MITIEIEDDGHAFNPLLDAPEPDLDAEVEDRTVGGLGIYLVRTMMDEVRYQRQQNKNCLTLVKRRGIVEQRACPRCAAALLVASTVLGEELSAELKSKQPGVSDRSILFGQSAAFSGPAQELGRNMRLGMQAAFREVNEQGRGSTAAGSNWVSLDDGYEPEAAIDNTRQLIEGERVFALIGAVGTPTSRAAVPIAEDAGVPYIAPFTGQ